MIESKLTELLVAKLSDLALRSIECEIKYDIDLDFLESVKDVVMAKCRQIPDGNVLCSVKICIKHAMSGVYLCSIIEVNDSGTEVHYFEYISNNETFDNLMEEYKCICSEMRHSKQTREKMMYNGSADDKSLRQIDKEYEKLREKRFDVGDRLSDMVEQSTMVNAFMPTYDMDLSWFVGMDADMDFY